MPTVAETFANAFTEERLQSLRLKKYSLGFDEDGDDGDGGGQEMQFVDGDTNEREHGQDGGDGGEMHFVDGDTNERGGDVELREDAFLPAEIAVGRLSLNDILGARNQRLVSPRK